MLRHILIILAAATFGVVPAAVHAQVQPTINFTVSPDTVPPGLSASFLFTLTNPTDTPQTFVGYATLWVTTSAGTFKAQGIIPGDVDLILALDQLDNCAGLPCAIVPARGQRDIYTSFNYSEFFADRRLSLPGRYQLQLTMHTFNGGLQPGPEIASNTQTLTVQEPTGDDAAVWRILQQINSGKGWSIFDWDFKPGGLVPRIEAEFPASTYAAWLAGRNFVGGHMSYTAALAEYDRALAKNLPRAIRDEKLLEKGGLYAAWSGHTIRVERNADLCVELADDARPILTQVRDTALSPYIRSRATKTLSDLFTREMANAELRFLAERDAPAPARLIPRVECVAKGSGQAFTARFGYSNPNKLIKVLQIGGDNLVSPAPIDQGQPRVFKPGSHPYVFSAASPGGRLKWHLDGNDAEATADFPVQCNGQ